MLQAMANTMAQSCIPRSFYSGQNIGCIHARSLPVFSGSCPSWKTELTMRPCPPRASEYMKTLFPAVRSTNKPVKRRGQSCINAEAKNGQGRERGMCAGGLGMGKDSEKLRHPLGLAARESDSKSNAMWLQHAEKGQRPAQSTEHKVS